MPDHTSGTKTSPRQQREKGSQSLLTKKALALSLSAPRAPPQDSAHRHVLLGQDPGTAAWIRAYSVKQSSSASLSPSAGPLENKDSVQFSDHETARQQQQQLGREEQFTSAHSFYPHDTLRQRLRDRYRRSKAQSLHWGGSSRHLITRHPHLPAGPELGDQITRFLGLWLPQATTNHWRDAGHFRAICDGIVTASVPLMGLTNPRAANMFLTLRKHRQCVVYGSQHTLQYMDVYLPKTGLSALPLSSATNERQPQQEPSRLILFLHGGAWGSGKPWMYRLCAHIFLQQGWAVAIPSYRTYPDGKARDQVLDVELALAYLRRHFPQHSQHVTLMGHSSGAHIGLLLLAERAKQKLEHSLPDQPPMPPIDVFVGLSGPYDISHHFDYEAARGVEELSPMKAACGMSRQGFRECSPALRLLDSLAGTMTTNTNSALSEHNVAAFLPPYMLLVHAIEDETVPFTSTAEAARVLRSCGVTQCQEYYIGPGTSHQDTVMQIMMGGPTQDTVLAWLKQIPVSPSSIVGQRRTMTRRPPWSPPTLMARIWPSSDANLNSAATIKDRTDRCSLPWYAVYAVQTLRLASAPRRANTSPVTNRVRFNAKKEDTRPNRSILQQPHHTPAWAPLPSPPRAAVVRGTAASAMEEGGGPSGSGSGACAAAAGGGDTSSATTDDRKPHCSRKRPRPAAVQFFPPRKPPALVPTPPPQPHWSTRIPNWNFMAQQQGTETLSPPAANLMEDMPLPALDDLIGWATHLVGPQAVAPANRGTHSQNNPLCGLSSLPPPRPSALLLLQDILRDVLRKEYKAAQQQQRRLHHHSNNPLPPPPQLDVSAVVALGICWEDMLTTALLPLARAHVARCRQWEDQENQTEKEEAARKPADAPDAQDQDNNQDSSSSSSSSNNGSNHERNVSNVSNDKDSNVESHNVSNSNNDNNHHGRLSHSATRLSWWEMWTLPPAHALWLGRSTTTNTDDDRRQSTATPAVLPTAVLPPTHISLPTTANNLQPYLALSLTQDGGNDNTNGDSSSDPVQDATRQVDLTQPPGQVCPLLVVPAADDVRSGSVSNGSGAAGASGAWAVGTHDDDPRNAPDSDGGDSYFV